MTGADWRERKKAATRRAIQEHALRLFLEKGYEATTVEEIAAAAGVSHMTFFRYFPRKEAVVESDDYDPLLAEFIAARPAHEDPLTAIYRALRQGLAAVLPDDRAAILIRSRLIFDTPALRARNWQNQDATQELFATALAHRDGAAEPGLRLRVLAGAALAALTTALMAWVETDGTANLISLVDEAFTALGAPASPADPASPAGACTEKSATQLRPCLSRPMPEPASRLNGLAFDPVTRIWVPAGSPGAVPVPPLRGALVHDAATLRWSADDFGHVVAHLPRAVLHPGAVRDITAMVDFAGRAGLPVAARGAGHSTYGQAQTAGGIVLDMTGLDQLGEVRGGQLRVQAGALWSDVLDAGLRAGRTPPVLTDYLPTTVGGTLAVGGIGGTSHRYGLQVDTVEELDVVTGAGQLVTCSAQRHRRLFDAVRAGLGQCGIVTSATLRLIPAPARVRRYLLGYRDLAGYLTDQRRLVRQQRFDYLEGQILPGAPDGWRYLVEGACYYTPPAAPDEATLLAGLGHVHADIADLGYREFAHRMAPGEAMLRASGEWLRPHAWLNVFLPEAATEQVVAAVLAELSPADLGHSGLVLLYPVRTDRLHAPLTRTPDAPLSWLFAVLRTASADDPTAGAALIEANRAGYDRALAHGGVAYPVNTLPMSPADWRAHFGPRWPGLLAAKDEFDPYRILAPGRGITRS